MINHFVAPAASGEEPRCVTFQQKLDIGVPCQSKKTIRTISETHSPYVYKDELCVYIT